MISTHQDILFLPSVPMAKLDTLPPKPGLYFVLSPENQLLYIGRSINLQQRWGSHHRKKQTTAAEGAVFYLEVDAETDMDVLEEELIQLLHPLWNQEPIPDDCRSDGSRAKKQISVRIDPEVYDQLADFIDQADASFHAQGIRGQAAARRAALILGLRLLRRAVQKGVSYEDLQGAVAETEKVLDRLGNQARQRKRSKP